MKRVLTCSIFLLLFFNFLIYAGVFRNNEDPVAVTTFYFECMKNQEWMLTYPVTKIGFFDEMKLIKDKERIFDKARIRHMQFDLSAMKADTAFVEAKLACEGQRVIIAGATLERDARNNWLIKEVAYE